MSSSQCDSLLLDFNNSNDNRFIMFSSVFEDFTETTDRFNNFGFVKAKISLFKTLAYVVKELLTPFFHRQVSFEWEFSTSDIVLNNNMKEGTIMAKELII